MTLDTLREEALDLQDETVELRRAMHERPELGNELPITRDLVLESLEGLPLDVTLHESTSGVAALLTGGRPGPTVLLRGDMDAILSKTLEKDRTRRYESVSELREEIRRHLAGEPIIARTPGVWIRLMPLLVASLKREIISSRICRAFHERRSGRASQLS